MQALALTLLLATIEPRALEALLDATVPPAMQKEQVPGAAFILVQNGRVVLAKGWGHADIERKQRVDPQTTIWPIASISKVFTATAVMQLADRKQLDVHADVNRYLKSVKVPTTYPQPVTAAHLLTHTGGFDELRGRMVQSENDRVQPLDRFLATRLIRVRPPGAMTAYSSFGSALAGLLVEDVSGMPFERYLACNVFAPLAMHRSQITVPESLRGDLAVAYEVDGGKVVPIPYERYHTPPASSISSSAADMGRFMMAMLAEGKGILSERAAKEMLTQQVTMHPRLPGFGYGWQMSDTNGQRIVEHGGNIGGFHSLMVLLPEQETGFFFVAHREGVDIRSAVREAILDRWFPISESGGQRPQLSDRVPERRPSAAARLEGTYRANIWCHTCPFDPSRVQDVRVRANADGSLDVWGERWIEVEPLFFRSPDGKRRIGFHQDEKGRITALTAGSWMVMERLPDSVQ